MLMRFYLCLLIFIPCFAMVSIANAADVECPIIADTVMCGHSSEKDMNCGGRGRLRVKGYQGAVVFRFNMPALKGQKTEGGTMSVYCAGISGEAQEKTFSEKISTIAHDWIEGTGDYTVSEDSATYLWPGKAIAKEWGKDDNEPSNRYGPIDVLDVINGFGGSIVNSQGMWDFKVGQWTEIVLDAELVQGLIDGEQYGIVVWSQAVAVNLDLASREYQGGQFAPKLVVRSGGKAVDAYDKLASTWGKLKL